MVLLAAALGAARLAAGPYSQALNDPANVYDAPVPGFIGPHGIGKAAFSFYDINNNLVALHPQNVVNPLFFGWAGEVVDYSPSDQPSANFADPQYALGPVTGDHFLGVVALGDMPASGIAAGDPPGTITLALERPARNLSGADFVVFENGVVASSNNGGAGAGHLFAELAYVEVSADGENFVRFPSVSLNGPLAALPEPLGTAYASMDVSNVRNLAGKHANGYGESWGTPFDLTDVGLQQITHIRLVDIPGTGDFEDSQNHPIYDPWETWGSGGFDLEAVGVVSAAMTFGGWPQLAMLPEGQRGPDDDPDGDGCVNLFEYAFATQPGRADAFAPGISMVSGKPAITVRRDERLTDVVYEVQAAPDLAGSSWVTIARSAGGGAFVPVNGHIPEITDEAAENIKSIGVLRRVTVRDAAATGLRWFLRVKVSLQPASLPGT